MVVADVDEAIRLHKPLEAFLSQDKDEVTSLEATFQRLSDILEMGDVE